MKQLWVICFATILLIHQACAVETEATVVFVQTSKAKEIVYKAFQQLYQANSSLLKLNQLATEAVNSALSDEERYQLDLAFQKELAHFKSELLQTGSGLIMESKNPMWVRVPYQGELYEYHIDLSDFEEIDERLELSEAPERLVSINKIISKIEQGFPDISNSLDKAILIDNDANPIKSSNQLRISNDSNYLPLINQLSVIRSELLIRFKELASLTEQFIDHDGSVNIALQYWFSYLDLVHKMYTLDIFAQINLFSDNALQFSYKKHNKLYHFPELSLEQFNFTDINILTQEQAQIACRIIRKMQLFIQDWSIESEAL